MTITDQVTVRTLQASTVRTQEAPMLRDPELAALLDQAARNLDTLELLAHSATEGDVSQLWALRERLAALKAAYTRETDALTCEVLKREVERRVNVDRRRSELQHT